MLFGCPLWMVGEMLPASEIPVWRAHFNSEPWGFNAMDSLFSKSAHQIAQVNAKLRPGTTYRDFMFADAYESLTLTKQQYEALSKDEQLEYVRRQIIATKQVLN